MAHSVASWALLVAVVALRPAQGLRQLQQKGIFYNTSHCLANLTDRNLCWEGPSTEPRLLALCGGNTKTQSGGCRAAGYKHDRSGASLTRFSVLLGLTVFAKDRGQVPLDLGDAVMAGALQNNELCPSVKKALETLGSKGSEILAPIVEKVDVVKGCVGHVRNDGGCIDAVTSVVVNDTISTFFKQVEKVFGIAKVRGLVKVQGLLPADSPIPQAVKDFSAVQDEILPKWDALVGLSTGMLRPLLTTLVKPIMNAHLANVLDSVFKVDPSTGGLMIGDDWQTFVAGVNSDFNGISDRIASWCQKLDSQAPAQR